MSITALLMNKKIALALGVIAFVSAIVIANSGAFFSDSASSTANVFSSGTLDLQLSNGGAYANTVTTTWNLTNLVPGGEPQSDTVWLKNAGSVDGMRVGLSMANTVSTQSGMAKQLRITEMTLDGQNLLKGGVGANLAGYEAPTNCTIEVRFGDNDYDTVSEAVNNAVANDVICVAPGNYTQSWETSNGGTGYPLRVDANNVVLVSTEGPDVTSMEGGVALDNDGTSVQGFTIGYSTAMSETFGVFVNTGVDDAVVSFNDIDGTGSTNGRGIINAYGSVTDMVIRQNYIHGWDRGIWFNKSTNALAEYNTISDNPGGGVSNDNPQGDVVRYNEFADNGSTAFAAAVDTTDILTLEKNNILGSNGNGVSQWGNGALIAQNNWWGDLDPSDQVTEPGTGTVDASNFAGGPFGGLINGNDANGNGYADLQDLYNNPILDSGVGLNGGAVKQFVMSIQLDGPTTGNEFQGKSLTTDFVFELNQI